jgi:hypothetical protein
VYSVGEKVKVKISGKSYYLKCIDRGMMAEVAQSWGESLGEFSLIIVLLVAITWILNLVTIEPSQAVVRAAQTMTASPVIVKGRIEFSKCSRGDLISFEISEGSKHIGYVCLGNPLSQKGATARFN